MGNWKIENCMAAVAQVIWFYTFFTLLDSRVFQGFQGPVPYNLYSIDLCEVIHLPNNKVIVVDIYQSACFHTKTKSIICLKMDLNFHMIGSSFKSFKLAHQHGRLTSYTRAIHI